DEVLREEQVERPVERDAELLLRARQLAEIDRPPEPPGEEAGEIDAEDARDAGPPPDRSELAERREAERRRVLAFDHREDVPCEQSSLTDGVLRGRGTGTAPLPVGDERTVTDRPETV